MRGPNKWSEDSSSWATRAYMGSSLPFTIDGGRGIGWEKVASEIQVPCESPLLLLTEEMSVCCPWNPSVCWDCSNFLFWPPTYWLCNAVSSGVPQFLNCWLLGAGAELAQNWVWQILDPVQVSVLIIGSISGSVSGCQEPERNRRPRPGLHVAL